MAVILVSEDGTPIVAASGALGAFTEDYKNQVELNTDARHTHTNKTILDNTTASYTIADKNTLTNLDTKVSGLVNPNLLINGDFRVYQRITNKNLTYTGLGYAFDCWKNETFSTLTVQPGKSGVSLTTTSTDTGYVLVYKFSEKDYLKLRGQTVTMSICINSNSGCNIYCRLMADSENLGDTQATNLSGIYSKTVEIPYNKTSLSLYIRKSSGELDCSIKYVKLEHGSVATAYSPRPYAEELAMCQVVEEGFVTTYSNPNLLINGDFRVNQRGLSSYTGSAIYTVDRWSTVMSTTKVTITDNGVRILLSSQYGKFRQRLKDFEYLKGKTVTISAKISYLSDLRDNLYFQIYQLNSSGSGDESIRVKITSSGFVHITGTILEDITALYVEFYTWSSGTEKTLFDIEWVKLELGTYPTVFIPKTYMEELNDCLSYYYKISNPWKWVGYGICNDATTAYITLDLPKPMITKPKVTISDPSLVRIKCGALLGQNTNQNSTETDGLTVDGFTYDTVDSINSKLNFGFTVSGATAGAFATLYIDKDGSIEFDAEI